MRGGVALSLELHPNRKKCELELLKIWKINGGEW
jgi:hypothetical protein